MSNKPLKIFLVYRTDDGAGYDEYDSFVVIAESAYEAKHTHPNPYTNRIAAASSKQEKWWESYNSSDWVHPDKTKATLIGTAEAKEKKTRVVCASFNAG